VGSIPTATAVTGQTDGTPLLSQEEELIFSLPEGVECHFDPSGPSEGLGSLYVTTKNVFWFPLQQNSPNKGFALDFPFIVMHAIAGMDSSLYGGRPCLYCQLEGDTLHEVAFIPRDPTVLQEMYAAFSRGAMLNPDEEQDGEGEFYYNESEVTGGAIDMSELEDALLEGEEDRDRFEDPDEH